MSSKLLTTGQAAKICAVTPDSVLKWVKSGRLPAQKTPGGHNRIDREDLERFLGMRQPEPAKKTKSFSYCWEFYSPDEELRDSCRDCTVFRTRARRCYEMARLVPNAGNTGQFCTHSCDDCEYFREVHLRDTNVLVISDDPSLTTRLKESSEALPFNLEFADCEYTASATINTFPPDFAIVDCGLGRERSRDIRRHLKEDPRIPVVRLILAAEPGGFPETCDQEVLAYLEKPFSLSEIIACVGDVDG